MYTCVHNPDSTRGFHSELFLYATSYFNFMTYFLPIKQRNKSIETIQVGTTERQQKLLL